MAKLASNTVRIWADEFALSGFLNSAGIDVKQEVIDVGCFSSTGPERIVGNYGHSGKIGGFFDAATGGLDPAVQVDLSTDEDHYLSVFPTGANEGSRGYDQVTRLTGKAWTSAVGGAVLLGADHDGSGPIIRSTLLRTATLTANNNGTGRNLGATTSGQLFAVIFRVIAVVGTGSFTLKLQESQNDGSPDTYADISGLSQSFSGVGVARLTTTSATEAWKRAVLTGLTGITSATIVVTAGVAPNT